jgi:hypothetical protein
MNLPALYDCTVCRDPIPLVPGESASRLCPACREFRTLLRVYLARVPHVSALSLKRLLNEVWKP